MKANESMKESQNTCIPSGFPMLDLLAGGYPKGKVIGVRYIGNEFQAGILAEYMERQAVNLALRQGTDRNVLLYTLVMDEKDLVTSLLKGEYASVPELISSRLIVQTIDKGRKLPTPEEFHENLKKVIDEYSIGAVIIDGIDELIPDDVHNQNAISAELLETLFELAAARDILTIVTDYGNVWEASHSEYPFVAEIELNEDVNGRTQGIFYSGKTRTVIEDLFHSPDSIGIELVRSALEYKRSNGRLPEAGDEFQDMVNAGATIISLIDQSLNTRKP